MVTRPRNVLDGVDRSAENYAGLPQKAYMGAECFSEDLFAKHIYDDGGRGWLPMEYVMARYDFSVDGGAKGDIELGVVVPAGLILLDGVLDVIDTLVSGAAGTIALKVEAEQDVLQTALVSSVGTIGLHALVLGGAVGNMIKTTAARTITLAVDASPLTSGVFVVALRCVRSFSS